MRQKLPPLLVTAALLGSLLTAGLAGNLITPLYGKEKPKPIDPNDPTFQLYQFIDTARGGKLADFYVVGDVYKDSTTPNEEFQHILRLNYDKTRGFGKLNLYVRSVGKIAPDQLRAYTPKDFYEFGVTDAEKFVKTDPGPFGKAGDVYLRAQDDRPLATAPITEEIRKVYESYLVQSVLPALQKK